MANRLAQQTSPYLQQHRDNPVDWYPWGEEAFDRARAEDRPVFLSVGYSSCHWCHVMEHESFENDEVAAALNSSFVSVKVDREERPDVDEAYMTAVQLSSGHGGWPMSVFLTPDKKPFFAGTYFPREDRGTHPGFLTICGHIANLWKAKRSEIEENAQEFALGLMEAVAQKAPLTNARFDEAFLADAVRALAATFDSRNGGFGGAPKFPPHTSIDFLLRYSKRESAPRELRDAALAMALKTLEEMALGGIHDHVGGGFHRYATDAEWHLPHFEKMLYDNALMLGNYATAAEGIADRLPEAAAFFKRTASGIAAWALREMRSEKDAYFSAQDADSEGEEGKFYAWTLAEIEAALRRRDAVFTKHYGVKREGNFRDEATGKLTGSNVLDRRDPAAGAPFEPFDAELELLRTAREQRVQPLLDEKVLVGWNGLMIEALARAGYLEEARTAANAILSAEEIHGGLPHQVFKGKPAGDAFLDGFAAFASGLFVLAEACRTATPDSPDSRLYRDHANRLTRQMAGRFWDEEEGGFYATSSGHEELFGRSKPVFDSPLPSANALALRCLVATGDFKRAERLVAAFLGWMERAPQATEALYAAAMPLLDGGPSSTDALPISGLGDVPAQTAKPLGTPDVAVHLEPREIHADSLGVGSGHVVIGIPEGFHINGNSPPARWLTPTALAFKPLTAHVHYPPAEENVYKGEVRIPFTIALPPNSSGEEFEVQVSYQACTDSECLAPTEKLLAGVLMLR